MNRTTLSFAILALSLSAAETAPSADRHRITLAGGETMEGLVVPLSECTFLIQTEDATIEVPAEMIDEVDGKADLSPLLDFDDRPPVRDETMERILENGDIIHHSTCSLANRGRKTIDHISWGIAAHEADLIPEWKVFDSYGNELVMTVEEPNEDGLRRARAQLVRPVLPGEAIRYADRIVFHDKILHEDGVLRYRHQGDYPESRIVTKMILLPAGAEVIETTPEPMRSFEWEGAPCLVWRHFFAKREIYPIEVTYKLGD